MTAAKCFFFIESARFIERNLLQYTLQLSDITIEGFGGNYWSIKEVIWCIF